MSSAGFVQVGTADPNGAATPILVDALAPPFTAMPVRILLTKDFAQVCPPGWPAPPHAVGSNRPYHPETFAAGTTLTLFANVAAALVAAGAGTAA